MNYRRFGQTGLEVSERGFGGWAIGGVSFGPVDEAEALRALAVAEDNGCNLLDTAATYGRSEEIVGKFLRGRRDRWVVATKYSGQPAGLPATLEDQLRRLGTDHIDLYQIHWVPRREDGPLYADLCKAKESGKVRFIGFSLYSLADIDRALWCYPVDAIQVCFGLLDPLPLLRRLDRIRRRGVAVLARSVLRGGFLAGSYSAETTFADARDQRSRWTGEEVRWTAEAVSRFRFLEADERSMLDAALAYPLSFPEVSTVIVSSKSGRQAELNFGGRGSSAFSDAELTRIATEQRKLGLLSLDLKSRIWELAGPLQPLMIRALP